MPRIRVKVCGITSPQDAMLAVNAGADAIGLILHAESPRLIGVDVARSIRAALPPFVSLVGVVVDAELSRLQELYQEIGLDYLQLHGGETSEFAKQLSLPYVRAIRARSKAQVMAEIAAHESAMGFLLDPYVPGQHGGTGQSLSADLWPVQATKPLILAGGLGAENLVGAIKNTNPYAVDLNSGVEASPGVKSAIKLEAAFAAINSVDIGSEHAK